MTGDAKKNVENKGAAAEQVALNTWCLPKENQNLRDRLAQQMDTKEWLSTVDRCGGGDSDRAAVAARLTELLQPVPLWTPHALVALLEREANSLAETGRTPGRAPTRGRAERTQEAEAEPTGAAEVGAEAERRSRSCRMGRRRRRRRMFAPAAATAAGGCASGIRTSASRAAR